MADPKIARLLDNADLLHDLAAAVRSTAVVFTHREAPTPSDILAVLADKLDLRGDALKEEVKEMRRY